MTQADKNTFDVIVVGAGFSGLYLIHKMRQLGYSVKVFEKGDDVGGTWYWNRYPGARCDIESVDYSFGFDEDLQKEWVWSERYATQPEILRYIQHVADRFDLRPDIAFETRVEQAKWNEGDSNWTVKTDKGEAYTSRIFIMATGCLSEPKDIDIKGVEDFGGEIYRTHSWPHEGVDFTGKRVGLIGTGSSGIQTVPMVAEQAKHLTVFQRTACYAIPAQNGPIWPEKLEKIKNYTEYREEARWTIGGVPGRYSTKSLMTRSLTLPVKKFVARLMTPRSQTYSHLPNFQFAPNACASIPITLKPSIAIMLKLFRSRATPFNQLQKKALKHRTETSSLMQ